MRPPFCTAQDKCHFKKGQLLSIYLCLDLHYSHEAFPEGVASL